MLAFQVPSYDRANSSDHVLGATAEFLIDVAFATLKVLIASLSKVLLWFSSGSPATPLISFKSSAGLPSPFFRAFPLQTFRQLAQLQHELQDELLAQILELLLRSLLVGSLKLVCLAPASKHVALPIYSDNCERFLPL